MKVLLITEEGDEQLFDIVRDAETTLFMIKDSYGIRSLNSLMKENKKRIIRAVMELELMEGNLRRLS